MADPRSKPDLDPRAMRQLIDALVPIMPALERLVEVWKKSVTGPTSDGTPTTCGECPDRRTCNELCSAIRLQLPAIDHGRSRQEHLAGHHIEELHEIQDRRRVDMFEPYERCKDRLSEGQYKAAYLRFRKGKTHQQIGTELGISRTAVTNLLKRARKIKESYEREMRAQRREYRPGGNSDET